MDNFKLISDALKTKHTIRCFLSGGGLRVCRLEKNKELIGYGEHPNLGTALLHMQEDLVGKPLTYKQKYGGKYKLYLTGSSIPKNNLDRWVRQGHAIDFLYKNKKFVLTGTYMKDVGPPKNVVNRVIKSRIKEVYESKDGFTYALLPTCFPNGEPCVSIEIIGKPLGKKPHDGFHDFNASFTIEANTFEELLSLAETSLPVDNNQ